MLFTDPAFLFLFLPALVAVYLPLEPMGASLGQANAVLVVATAVFYALGARWFSVVAAAVVVATHWVARGLDLGRMGGRMGGQPAAVGPLSPAVVGAGQPSRGLLLLGVLFNLAVLAAVEVSSRGLVRTMLSPAIDGRLPEVRAAVIPFGMSIVSLHAISYLVDVFRGEARPQRDLLGTGLYLLFFPCLVAGPIVRYREVAEQIGNRTGGLGSFAYGVRRFVIGWGKVVFIASTLAVTVDRVFALPSMQLTTARAWLGAACFTGQIYFALAGYADMAVGLGRMFGFRLPENFRWPYLAQNLHEFWRGWFMSLVAWVRDYLPLGRRPGREVRGLDGVPLIHAFFLIGLWHGVKWTLLYWAVYHAVFMGLEATAFGALVRRLPVVLRRAYVLVVVIVGFAIFRAETPAAAGVFLRALEGRHVRATAAMAIGTYFTWELWVALAAAVVGSLPLARSLGRWRVAIDATTISIVTMVLATLIFSWRTVLTFYAKVSGGRPPDWKGPDLGRRGAISE
jgi:alginate O-acetyltransferase complex protein AlgI